ncbi:MAG: MFS transporter [Dehalococcoidia bacterium]
MVQTKYRVYEYRWVVLAVYMYVAALTQLYWLNFASITTYMEDRFNIPAGDVMWLSLVFALVQVPLTLPAGILIDKKGFRYGFCLGAIITGIFPLLRLIYPGSYAMLLVSQICISIGQPFVLNCLTKLAVTWFSPREEATAVGLGSLAVFAGMMLGLGATPWLVQFLGFEAMLLIYGILGIIGGLLPLIFVRSGPPTPARSAEIRDEISSWNALKEILRIKDFVILGFIAFMGIGVFCALISWLEKILHDLHRIPMVDAGSISAVLMLGSMIGCIAVPVVSDKIGKRKILLVLTTAASMICMCILIFADSYEVNMVNGILLGFCMISARPIMYTMSAEFTGPRYAGLSIGYLMLMGGGATLIITQIMECLSTATGDFVASLVLLVALLLISLILSIWVKDAHPAA